MPKPKKKLSHDDAVVKLQELFDEEHDPTSLTWNYRVGQVVAARHPIGTGSTLRESVIQNLADQIKTKRKMNLVNLFFKTRKLVAYYSLAEVRKLAKLTDKYGQPFSWHRMIFLLSEPDANKRAAIGERSLREGWPLSRLKHELIQRHGGKRGQGGRRPIPSTSRPLLIVQLKRLCDQWEHWGTALGLPEEDGTQLPAATKKLTPESREQLSRTLKQVSRLKSALLARKGK